MPRKKVSDGEDNGSLNGRRVQFQLSAEATAKIIATNIERISHGEIPATAVNSVLVVAIYASKNIFSSIFRKVYVQLQSSNLLNHSKCIIGSMADKNEYPEKYGWWISELNSLGINTDGNNEKSADAQGLEDLTDDVKQNFIRDYKTRYSGQE